MPRKNMGSEHSQVAWFCGGLWWAGRCDVTAAGPSGFARSPLLDPEPTSKFKHNSAILIKNLIKIFIYFLNFPPDAYIPS